MKTTTLGGLRMATGVRAGTMPTGCRDEGNPLTRQRKSTSCCLVGPNGTRYPQYPAPMEPETCLGMLKGYIHSDINPFVLARSGCVEC
jgi:hypothetical protein